MEYITKESIYKSLGDVFKKYRIKNHLTQENIAEKLGISVKYISRIENGTGGVKLERLVNYFNILGIIPNIAFGDLIKNEKLNYQLELSKKVEDLSDSEIKFIIGFIDLMKNLNNGVL